MHATLRAQSIANRRSDSKRRSLALIALPAMLAAHPYFVTADWSDSKALREQQGELIAEVEAIQTVAQEEKRDLSDEESARVDQILGLGTEGEDGFKPGLVHDLNARIAQREKMETARDRITAGAGSTTGNRVPPQGGDGDDLHDSDNQLIQNGFTHIAVPTNCIQPTAKEMEGFEVVGNRQEQRGYAYALGRYFFATLGQHQESKEWCDDHGVVIRDGKNHETVYNAQSGGTPSKGGYLVPTELSTVIREIRDRYGVFRSECTPETMSADTKDVAFDISGDDYYFVGESEEIGEADSTWINVGLVAKKVGRISRYSSEIAEDAIIEMGVKLAGDMGRAFAKAEDDCAIVADGTAQYGNHTGLFNAIGDAAVLTVDVDSLDQLTRKHFRKAMSMLPDVFRDEMEVKWYLSHTAYDDSMANILDASPGNRQEDLSKGPSKQYFLGHQVRYARVLPSAQAAIPGSKCIIFGNWRRGAMFGDRRKVTIAHDSSVFFKNDDMAVRGTQRFNLKIHQPGDADDVGAFVVIQLAGGGE